jgi:hypothetical protein
MNKYSTNHCYLQSVLPDPEILSPAMTKLLAYLILLLTLSNTLAGQMVSGKLKFQPGQVFNIRMEIKASVAQQAMNQAIDFNAGALALHTYQVRHTTPETTTLFHEIKKINFNFAGMGQKRDFDSGNPQDMEGIYGETVKKILAKTFEVTIDPAGLALETKPEKMDSIQTDERLAIVFTMLKDVTDVVYPPGKGEPSFFMVLPAKPREKGDSWTDSSQNEKGKFNTVYTIRDITDSLVLVDFQGTSQTTNKVMMMGMETLTTLNSTTGGKIIIDRQTGLVKEKMITTESNGNTEAMGGTMPVTTRTTITIHVNPGL